MKHKILNAGKEAAKVIEQTMTESWEEILNASKLIANTYKTGGKVLVMGNGGSCCDAEHIAAEMMVRFKKERNRKPYPAIVLSIDNAYLTACSNDYGYKLVFKRSLEALYAKGDALLFLSTSGRSENITECLKYAKSIECKIIGLIGGDGGEALKFCTNSIVVTSFETARIQEAHRVIYHTMVDLVEEELFT